MKKIYYLILMIVFGVGVIFGQILSIKHTGDIDDYATFCEGFYLGILGTMHNSFDAHMANSCSQKYPGVRDLIDNFGEYQTFDIKERQCINYTCNLDEEMTNDIPNFTPVE